MKLKLCVLFCALTLISADSLPKPRIVGGTNATDGQVPYQCSLRRNNGQHFCGCSILSKNWIVTAAHCMSNNVSNVGVLVGTNDLKSGGTTYKAIKSIIHEKFNRPRRLANDIALIQVENIQFNDKVQPIKYSSNFVDEATTLQTSGWGRLAANRGIPRFLQVINITAISNQRCKLYYGNSFDDTHLCTLTKRGEGVCSGDSGGPLVLNGELVGVTSFAVLCARGYPDGFMRISYVYDWIRAKIGS